MNIVLDEREYAENVLQSHNLGPKPTEALTRVARYYLSFDGAKKSDARQAVEEFMLRCDPNINLVKWQEALDHIMRNAAKHDLINIDSVPITQKELDVCGSLPGDTKRTDLLMYKGTSNKPLQRLLFTLICLAKYFDAVSSKNNGWVNRPDKEIFKLANVLTSVKRQSLMLNDLLRLGCIGFSRKVDNVNIKVLCIDHTGEPVMQITDFRNLGYRYMMYCGEPYIECEQCGLVTRRRKNIQKYCPDCAIDVDRQKARERMSTRRSS